MVVLLALRHVFGVSLGTDLFIRGALVSFTMEVRIMVVYS